jgi:hypothetical protein
MGLEWILGRLAGGVEWIQLGQNRDTAINLRGPARRS